MLRGSRVVGSANEKWGTWVGYALSATPILVLLRSAWMKVSADPQVVQQVVEHFGYPASSTAGIGLLELTCVLVYAVPRTAALGAVLLTGFLGGAVATHVRIGEPFMDSSRGRRSGLGRPLPARRRHSRPRTSHGAPRPPSADVDARSGTVPGRLRREIERGG